jgi:hypothetical protein
MTTSSTSLSTGESLEITLAFAKAKAWAAAQACLAVERYFRAERLASDLRAIDAACDGCTRYEACMSDCHRHQAA